ncbi:hypothetical protein [Lacimicrobium alkaliphilum]|uniref:hypothetical protein n=1 Tax=Lacimicrobium alkaliphilum TaxID=1526571 RepID=UPI0012E3C448|nr:hypothetical protein [Lacimicrobium alkaliphilum]
MDYIKVVLLTIAAYSISIMSFAGEPPAGCVEGTSTDLTTEGPKYAAIGVTHQYKGDYPFSIPPIDEYVDFFNSEVGYVGSDQTNLDSNAYYSMSFSSSARGLGWVWTVNEATTKCSSLMIYIHTLPTGSANSISGGNKITTNISANIDSFSKNSIEGNGLPKITYVYLNTYWNREEKVISTSTQKTPYPQYNGIYNVSARISDGTYSKTIQIGSVFYNGGQDCSSCGDIP